MDKPPLPTDPATARAWLAWAKERDPETGNRRHPEGCQCHGCLRAREIEAVGRLCALAMERVRAEIAEQPDVTYADCLTAPDPYEPEA